MANEILDAIHKNNPLPKKIDSGDKADKSKTTILAKGDSVLTLEEREFARLLYIIMKGFLDKAPKKFYNLDSNNKDIEKLNVDTDVAPTFNLTKIDFKYKKRVEELMLTKNEYVFASEILKAFNVAKAKNLKLVDPSIISKVPVITKSVPEQTEFLRCFNHVMREKEDKADARNDAYYNYLTNEKVFLKESLESLRTFLPEAIENVDNDPMNHDFDRGLLPSITNEIINLCNRYLKNLDNSVKIEKLPSKADKTEQEIEKNLNSADTALDKLEKSILGKIRNFLNPNEVKGFDGKTNNERQADMITASALSDGVTMSLDAVGDSINTTIDGLMKESVSIKSIAKLLREATNAPEEKIDEKEKEFQEVKEFYPDRPFAKFNSYQEMVDTSWKSPDQAMKDDDAKQYVSTNIVPLKKGKDMLNYLNSLKGNQDGTSKLLDVISRQMYFATNGKQSLYELDTKASYSISSNWPEFEEYINIESDNRAEDEEDLTFYESKKTGSGYEEAVADYKQLQKNKKAGEAAAEAFSDPELLKKVGAEIDAEVEKADKEINAQINDFEDKLSKGELINTSELDADTLIKNAGIDVQNKVIKTEIGRVFQKANDDAKEFIANCIDTALIKKVDEIITEFEDAYKVTMDNFEKDPNIDTFESESLKNIDDLINKVNALYPTVFPYVMQQWKAVGYNYIDSDIKKVIVKYAGASKLEEMEPFVEKMYYDWLNNLVMNPLKQGQEAFNNEMIKAKQDFNKIIKEMRVKKEGNEPKQPQQESIASLAEEMNRIVG